MAKVPSETTKKAPKPRKGAPETAKKAPVKAKNLSLLLPSLKKHWKERKQKFKVRLPHR